MLYWRILEAHREALQRLCAALWLADAPPLLIGRGFLGFAPEASDSQPAADAARLRESSVSLVFDRRRGEITASLLATHQHPGNRRAFERREAECAGCTAAAFWR